MTAAEVCDAVGGCPCHGYCVTVWVQGPASQEEADALVARLLDAAPPGTLLAVVPG